MEIKIESKDLKYFNDLNNAALEAEQNIAALDIEWFKIMLTYQEIKRKYAEFSKQIRVKYEVTHPEAIIDLDRGVIEIPDADERTQVEIEEQNDMPLVPPPPPKRIITEDVEMPKRRAKKVVETKEKA